MGAGFRERGFAVGDVEAGVPRGSRAMLAGSSCQRPRSGRVFVRGVWERRARVSRSPPLGRSGSECAAIDNALRLSLERNGKEHWASWRWRYRNTPKDSAPPDVFGPKVT